MKFEQRPVLFDCLGERLVGIACLPESPSDIGVLVVVGGPQYRAGSHRQFVHLARALAAAGYAALRFDVRGMGDSTGEPRSFEAIDDDIASALSAFRRIAPTVRRFVLWGLCDGASAALMYVEGLDDPSIAGLALLNPWVRTEASLARTQVKHYYSRRVMQPEFWRKLARGRVKMAALGELVGNMRVALRRISHAEDSHATGRSARPYQQRMAVGWQRFEGRMLLILSGDDYTAKEFIEFVAGDAAWRGAMSKLGLQRHDLADADHTFSKSSWRRRAEAAMVAWMQSSFSSSASKAPNRGEVLP